MAEQQTWWQVLIIVLSNLALPILVAVLAPLAVWLAAKIGIKLNYEQIDRYLGQAVAFADQKLKKAMKDKKPPADKNAARMQWAKEFIEPILEKTGLMKWVAGKLEDMLEAKLGINNEDKDK